MHGGCVARAALLLLALALGACVKTEPIAPSSRPVEGEEAAPSLTQFSDIPIPSNSTMNLEDTLILGSQEGWLGRLALRTAHDAGEVNEFYRAEMPKFGWNEVTSVRAEVSVHTYVRGERVATVRIQGGSLDKSSVEIIVSPKAGGTRSPY